MGNTCASLSEVGSIKGGYKVPSTMENNIVRFISESEIVVIPLICYEESVLLIDNLDYIIHSNVMYYKVIFNDQKTLSIKFMSNDCTVKDIIDKVIECLKSSDLSKLEWNSLTVDNFRVKTDNSDKCHIYVNTSIRLTNSPIPVKKIK